MTPRLKRNIYRILPFGVIWLIFGVIFLTVEYAATKDYQYTVNGAIKLDFTVVVFALTAVTIVGCLIGTIELLFINRLFSKASFAVTVLGKFVIYSLFLFLIIGITYPIAASIELNSSIANEQIWNKFSDFLGSITFLSTGFQMIISLFVTLFYNEISEKIGAKSFLNFVTGKYHRPQVEQRIFMFIDMKSSTTLAEQLGHFKYFKLLRSYYGVLSESIIDYSGEIYQYVGDEMVITWELKKGISNNNCVHCFFRMKEDLIAKQDWFFRHYGVCPEFKGSLHTGEVVTGEIGTLKKDLIFTGDTLNTASRIQGLCNDVSAELLVSSHMMAKLKLEETFESESLGLQDLKGKKKEIEVFSIRKKNSYQYTEKRK